MKMLTELKAGIFKLTSDEKHYEHEHVIDHARLMDPRLSSVATPSKQKLSIRP